MPCAHSLVPVGMMGIQTFRDSLNSDLQQIYEGDTDYSPEACNAIHVYQEYYNEIPEEPGGKLERAIAQYKKFVQRASAASNGRLKCLVGDFTQMKAFDSNDNSLNYFYDGTRGNLNANAPRAAQFVTQFIDSIGPGLADNVLGWYLADEPHEQAGTPKRQLSWEYNYDSVQQKAVNSVSPYPGQADKLGATAMFFDGKDNCGNGLQGEYTCRMLLDSSEYGSTLSLYINRWVVNMSIGWNLMSFPVNKCFYQGDPPTNQPACVELVDIADLGFTALADWFDSVMSEEWLMVIGVDGVMDSTLPPTSHSLKYMSPCLAYWVKLAGNSSMSSNGQLFDPDCAIPLPTGWSMVGYPLNVAYYDTDSPPSDPDVLMEGTAWVKVDRPVGAYVFASIAGKYSLVTGEHGVYDPALSPLSSSLRYISPGTGYWIKMNEEADLKYSEMGTDTGERASIPPEEPAAISVLKDGRPLAVIYGNVTQDEKPVDVGSRVEVFSQGGVLCGEFTVTHKGQYGAMLVYGDDGLTSQANGAKPGEKLIFRVNGKPARVEKEAYWTKDKDVQRVDLVIG